MNGQIDLSSIIIFKDLNSSTLDKILELPIGKVNYNPGDLVISEGELLEDLLVIKSGLLKQAKLLEDGSEKVVAYYYENEVYPLHLFYADINKWPYDIYAEWESEIYLIPWKKLRPIIDNDVELLNNIIKFTAHCTCHTKMILNATRYKKIQERIAYWLVNMKYIDSFKIPATQKMLSDTIRVTRPSLNQELKKLESLGVIEIDINEIRVIDEEYLEDILEDV
ncbi:Crp/Fnr family transcriptional regulator [Lagierella sp.]|uniref:Crp/Fnr family transcriptional regulator n=1 Tax=Lagierella sp. TaxID=2849657 RepID=UPI00260BEF57|nr:Crp/Fnr family transcriptional regulator [Lagierella sp.]